MPKPCGRSKPRTRASRSRRVRRARNNRPYVFVNRGGGSCESGYQAPYNAGLYTGAPFSGCWGNTPVEPTTTSYINKNLQSAEPPPGATTQYPGTARLGNNCLKTPGVGSYRGTAKNCGKFNLHVQTGGTRRGGGKGSRRRRTKLRRRSRVQRRTKSHK